MTRRIFALLTAFSLGSSVALAAEGTHWGYTGHTGPEHWGELDPGYTLCERGMNQSPVNLQDGMEADLQPIAFDYSAAATEILNNGHTVQANFAPDSRITVNGHAFALKQVHFHTPSENLIEGKSFPLEAHLVHGDQDGRLAVVAVMFADGKENPALSKLWRQMPAKQQQRVALASTTVASELLPSSREYYRFNGSLTTPPCTEGVLWLVMKEPVSVSQSQVEHFARVVHHPNNRPVQPLNARMILR